MKGIIRSRLLLKGIGSKKGRLVVSLFYYLTAKRKIREKSKRWNPCKLNPSN